MAQTSQQSAILTTHGVIFTFKRNFTEPCSFFLLNPALTELAAVATDDGAPVDGGSPNGAALAPTSDSAPGECLPVVCGGMPTFPSPHRRFFCVILHQSTGRCLRKRKHMAAARADDTDDGAAATAVSAAGASPRPTKGRKRTSSRGD